MKYFLTFLFSLVSAYVFAQAGQVQPKYYFTGSVKVGSQTTGNYAPSYALFEIGNDTTNKVMVMARGYKDSISGAKTGSYIHDIVSNSLYSFVDGQPVRQLNQYDLDTISDEMSMALFQQNNGIIYPVMMATDSNQRNDNGAIIKDGDEYIIAWNRFGANIADPAEARIVSYRTKKFEGDFYAFDTIANPLNHLTALNPSFIKKENGDIVCIYVDLLNSDINPVTGRAKVYKTRKIFGEDVWSAPELAIDSNRRMGTSPSRTFKYGDLWLYPFYIVDSGTGNSSGSASSAYLAKSYDEGESWQSTGIKITDGRTPGKDLLAENGMYSDPRLGNTMYFRTLRGEVRKTVFSLSDTGFTNPSHVQTLFPAQNALTSIVYDSISRMRIAATMRYLGQESNKQRQYIDLMVSDNGISWQTIDVVDYADGVNELNEPIIYLEDSFFVVAYSKSHMGIGHIYYDFYVKKYPRHFLNRYGKPVVMEGTSVVIAGGSGTPNTQFGLKFQRSSVGTDSLAMYIWETSASSADAVNNGAWGIRAYGPGKTTFNFDLSNIRTQTSDMLGYRFNHNVGDTGVHTKWLIKDIPVMKLTKQSLRIPVSKDNSNTNLEAFGETRVNPNVGSFEYTLNGIWKKATENFFYDLKLAKFANDSVYNDTSMKGKLITIFDNSTGRYLDDTAYSMLPTGGFKFTTKKVTGSDRFIARVESVWQDGLMPSIYPLDTLGVPYLAVSFRKLRDGYNGPLCQLTSLADGSTLDVYANPYGTLDTIAINNWSGKDTAYISRWYNQGSSSTSYFRSQTIPPGARFRKVNGEVYAEFDGSSYMNTNDNTANTMNFIHDGTKLTTITQVFRPTNVTTTSVYGLFGNSAGTTTTRGIYAAYDHRSGAGSNNALLSAITLAVNTQFVTNCKYNNTTMGNNLKSVLYTVTDPANATAANRQKIWINASTVQTPNTATNAPTSGTAPTSFSLGSTGSNNTRMKGHIFEFILYDKELTTTQIDNLRENQRVTFNIY